MVHEPDLCWRVQRPSDLPSVVREVLGHVEIHRHVVTVVGVAPLALHHSHHTSLHRLINVEQSES